MTNEALLYAGIGVVVGMVSGTLIYRNARWAWYEADRSRATTAAMMALLLGLLWPFVVATAIIGAVIVWASSCIDAASRRLGRQTGK